jgi:biotin carboxyl carrier protein
VLESMKTEIPVAAPAAGRVSNIPVGEGDAVEERQTLLILES